ncbi:Ig-like domain-containing protein [Krasilnikovia sp. MM14-A1259]|uniref:Ig-like domain-containing protein n=1 Tax=Krasilnikovia sp. MM14-A1259 TaxID=3373539 RepID=UPI003801EC6F
MGTPRWAHVGLAALVSAAVMAPAAPAFADPSPSTITVSGPSTVARNTGLTLTGTFSGGAGMTLNATKSDSAGQHALPAVTTGGGGAFTLTDVPSIGGTNTYTISFAGDVTNASTSADILVEVSRAASRLTLSTDATNYRYGATARLTAKLGTTHDNRRVCLYATPISDSRQPVRCATANSAGVVTATWRMTRRTTFRAVYDGDQWYAPVTATRTATAGARIEQALAYSYKTSGGYKVYRSKVDPLYGARVSPDHSGGCLAITLQRYRGGKWRHVAFVSCAPLNENSITAGWLRGKPHPVGSKWRVRAKFAGDSVNSATTGSWQRYRFTR